MINWHINIREEGLTLLDVLTLKVPAAPRGFLHKLIKKNRVTLNSRTVSAETKVHYGEIVTVGESQRLFDILKNSPLSPEDILYEDAHCIVISKAAGLAIHRAQGHDDNLLHRVQDFFHLRGEKFRVAPVQRLDIGTSGAVLIGKGKDAISELGKLIMAGDIRKRYLALIHGRLDGQGTLDSPVYAKGNLKWAATRYQVVETIEAFSLLNLELETGRQHQIRQQLADFSHPIIGDKRYGLQGTMKANRTMLHSYQLEFINPSTKQEVKVLCRPADDFCALALKLGFNEDTLQRLSSEK